MATLHDLLLNCKLNPLDKEARLILADYLEDQDDLDRAELVRLQMRSSGLHKDWHTTEVADSIRELRLRREHCYAWCRGYHLRNRHFTFVPPPNPPGSVVGGKFQNGMITLSGSSDQLQSTFDAMPDEVIQWVEGIRIDNQDNFAAVRSLLADSRLDEISTLYVKWGEDAPQGTDLLDRRGIRSIFNYGKAMESVHQHLSHAKQLRLHALSTGFESVCSDGWEALASSSVVADLQCLNLHIPHAEPTGYLQPLIKNKNEIRLKRLDIGGLQATASEVSALLRSPVASELESLRLMGSQSGQSMAQAITESTVLPSLRTLSIVSSISAGEGRAMAQSSAMEQLTQLELGGSIAEEALIAIVSSPLLGPLERLEIKTSTISDAALQAIASSPRMQHLRHLSMRDSEVSETGLRAFVESPWLSELQSLTINGKNLTPNSVALIAHSKQLGSLIDIQLSDFQCGPEVFHLLVNSEIMRPVQSLYLRNCLFTDDHLKAMVESPMLRSLRSLSMYRPIALPAETFPWRDAAWLDQLQKLALYGVGLNDTWLKRLMQACQSGELGSLHLVHNALTDKSADALMHWPGLSRVADLSLFGNPMTRERQIALEQGAESYDHSS